MRPASQPNSGKAKFGLVKRLYLIAWIIWLIDFATKSWALVKNYGAAFSFATGATFILSIFACCVVAAIAYYAPKITSKGWAIVIGLALGGIVGNLTDRIFRAPGFFTGHVIDWIELPNWPVFNIADTAIVVATAIAVVLSIKNISPIETANVEKKDRSEEA